MQAKFDGPFEMESQLSETISCVSQIEEGKLESVM